MGSEKNLEDGSRAPLDDLSIAFLAMASDALDYVASSPAVFDLYKLHTTVQARMRGETHPLGMYGPSEGERAALHRQAAAVFKTRALQIRAGSEPAAGLVHGLVDMGPKVPGEPAGQAPADVVTQEVQDGQARSADDGAQGHR
jgi:hypothetical protein